MRAISVLLITGIFASVICEGNDEFHMAPSVPRQRDKTTFGNYHQDIGDAELAIEGKGRTTVIRTNNTEDVIDGICTSVDVRNSIDKLNGIKDCFVIEGFLRIIQTNVDEMGNITFPKLREITGYLLLDEVNGLKSLASVFPNLEVIRGQHTINGHVLMVYEMPDLQEVSERVQWTKGKTNVSTNLNGGLFLGCNPITLGVTR